MNDRDVTSTRYKTFLNNNNNNKMVLSHAATHTHTHKPSNFKLIDRLYIRKIYFISFSKRYKLFFFFLLFFITPGDSWKEKKKKWKVALKLKNKKNTKKGSWNLPVLWVWKSLRATHLRERERERENRNRFISQDVDKDRIGWISFSLVSLSSLIFFLFPSPPK